MRSMLFGVISWFAVMSVCSLFSYAQAQPKPDARAIFEEAEVHYRLQEFDAALNKYKEAYTLSRLPGHLVNIGQCYRQLGRYREALLSFQSFLDEAPGSSLRPQIEKIIEDLKPLALNEPINTPPQNNPTTITPEWAPLDEQAQTERTTPLSLAAPSPKKAAPPNPRHSLLYGVSVAGAFSGVGFAVAGLSSAVSSKRSTEPSEIIAKNTLSRQLGFSADILLLGSALSAGYALHLSRQEGAQHNPAKLWYSASLSTLALGLGAAGLGAASFVQANQSDDPVKHSLYASRASSLGALSVAYVASSALFAFYGRRAKMSPSDTKK